jgi:putative FmdB family regulatory protein
MPFYEYSCPACGKEVERRVSIEERDKQVCECTNFLSRKVSAPQRPIFNGVQATCSMGVGKMADVSLTTDPR